MKLLILIILVIAVIGGCSYVSISGDHNKVDHTERTNNALIGADSSEKQEKEKKK